MKKKMVLGFVILFSLTLTGQNQHTNFPALRGPYLGQTPPGNISKVFASGFVSTEYGELNSVFNRDGNEFCFSRRGVPGKQSKIMMTRLENDIWTEPEPVGFSTSYSDIDLFITPDGLSMVFCSNRPHQKGDGAKTDHDFWISKREGKKFAEPQLFAKEALSEFEDIFWVSTEFIETLRPVEDVFKVMEIVTGQNNDSLWPNFRTSEIPVLVFDSINTWLFHSKVMPEGFSEVREHPKVYRFPAQHPLVRGNAISRMGDGWVAASIFSRYAQRTGERYSAKDLAGIIIHEQFHIYSRNKHPRWVPNDGLLLLYPAETQDALFLRRIEKEAFKRAVTSEKPEDICGWAKEGLKYRDQRMSSLPPVIRLYEPELQRTEGLSDYIEKIARGLDPLNASEITDGIAPAGVRDLGYVEGRWIAMILDKLNPGWKTILETSDTLYLENILKNVVSDLPYESKSLSRIEIDKIKTEANSDLILWREKQKKEVEQFDRLPGFRVEINASSKPLNIWIFEPLEIEILEDGSVYHRVIFSAGNEAGSLRIRDLPCLTGFNNSLGVTTIQIHGLSKEPEINEKEKRIKITDGRSSLDLKYSTITIDRSLCKVEL